HSTTYADLGEVPDEYHYAPPVPEAPGGRPRFIGTPEEVVADLRDYVAAGVDHFALRFWAGTPGVEPAQLIEQMRVFAELGVPGPIRRPCLQRIGRPALLRGAAGRARGPGPTRPERRQPRPASGRRHPRRPAARSLSPRGLLVPRLGRVRGRAAAAGAR